MFMKRISMAVCLFVAACGGGDDSKPAAEPTAYADMSFQEREAFMTDVVMPQMRETFVAFDPKFEAMSCQTCHGNGAIDGSYAMPSPQIAVLPATEEAFAEYVKDPEHARWSQFMLDEVWPQMANLLQVPMFDHTTNPDGFSCSNCHTVDLSSP
jgi:hypothetical protein